MQKRIIILTFLVMILVASCVVNPTLEIEPEPLINTSESQIPTITHTVVLPTDTPVLGGSKDIESEVVDDDSSVEKVGYLFDKQPGSPTAIPSWLYGCEWFGVAGQVFDVDGHPMENLIVEAGGILDNQPVLGLSLAGTVFDYGPGGYEIQLANFPVESSETIWIQLKDLDGVNLSPKVFLQTEDDCNQNTILLNFLSTGYSEPIIYYFPNIHG